MAQPKELFNLVCGDAGVHRDGCVLGAAETIAAEAAALAAAQGKHELVAVVTVLAEAGILRPLTDADPDDMLDGLLDYFYECGLVVQP